MIELLIGAIIGSIFFFLVVYPALHKIIFPLLGKFLSKVGL